MISIFFRNAVSLWFWMLHCHKIIFLSICLCAFSATVCCFNVEERFPIVRTGPNGSLFGLSVAQHHIDLTSTNRDNAVLLVGAPTDDPKISKTVERPGALYKCLLSSESNCTRVPIIYTVNPQVEIASGQWLGVAVKSHKPGGKIAVCAHRYALQGSLPTPWEAAIGRCFMLNPDVTPVEDLLSYEYVPCQGKQDDRGNYNHEWFGYCQAGVSVNFADVPSDIGNNEFLVVGAPGSLTWRGVIYMTGRSADLFGFNVEQVWSQDRPDRVSKVLKNSLMGSSLASGGIYSEGGMNFVSGAPGANATGAVFIYDKRDGSDGATLHIVEIINGDKVASRFGHEVILTDVTGDGRLDLIIGAPQYYDGVEKVGGAVYVFVNKGLSQIGSSDPQKLYGKVDSYFGMSIVGAGDINMDGANDIIVGAPGEDDWTGAIYIYHGDNGVESNGVDPAPSQVIKGKTLEQLQGLRGMGYSLSSGLDMDFNGYPDIAVGSLSDSAIVFLTRPVVNIHGNITGPAKKIDLSGQSSKEQLDIKVCLRYDALPTSFNDKVQVSCMIRLDTARIDLGFPSRISFSNSSNKENGATKAFSMTLHPQALSKNKCRTWKAYMEDDIQDKLSPILMELSFTTNDKVKKRRRRQTSIRTPLPIMNTAISNTSVAQIEFAKQCGEDEICKSNLEKTAFYQVLKNGNWTNLKERDGHPLLVLGTEEQIGLVIEVTNNEPGEDAHQATMNITLPEEVQYRSIEMMSGSAIHCDPSTDNESLVVCHLGNPMKAEKKIKFKLKLSKNRSIHKATQFVVRLQLLTTSQQLIPDSGTDYLVFVEVEAQLVLSGYPSKEQVQFAGEVVGESAVKKPSDAGELHTHTYEVSNSGTGVVEDVELIINWPQAINNGKWLFYLLDAEVSDSGNCTLPSGVNPLGLNWVDGRKKRDAETPPGALEVFTKEGGKEYKSLNCRNGDDVSCLKIDCFLGNLSPSNKKYIQLHAILWNSTFLEEFERDPGVYVTSYADVTILQKNVKFSDSSRLEASVTTTVLPQELIVPVQQITWWIVVVASAAGVILLVFLILIMWKCGFFKRQKFGDYQKARKHKQASKKAEEKESLY